jgi:hypothetical protein
MADTGPDRFSIGINRLYPGEKLPTGDPRWGEHTGSFHQERHTIETLINLIRQGFAFSPVMRGAHRNQANFISAQHIGLDSDTGDDRSSLAVLAKDSFIAGHAAFLYSTHSSTPEHSKARIVFILDRPITDRAQYRLAQQALAWKYDFTDQSVAEEARFFYGSVGCEVRRLGHVLTLATLAEEVTQPFLASLRTQADEDQRAPHISDDQILGNTLAERYINRAIQEEVAWLSTRIEGTGERHRGLLIAAIKLQSLRLAEWLPAEIRSQIDPHRILLPAAERNGYVIKYGEQAARCTIADGMAYALPRPRPEWWGAETNGHKTEESKSGKLEESDNVSEDTREKKLSAADRAVEYVLAAKTEMFHDQYGEAFIAFRNDQERREIWPLKSKAATDFIRWTFYTHEAKGLSGEALATARGTLSASARFKGRRIHLAVRVAYQDGAYWYDLGDWRAVSVSAEGWKVVDSPPIVFRHFPHQGVQSEPIRSGKLDGFMDLLNIKDQNTKLLAKVYLVAGLVPGIPMPVLITYGEHGSAKSSKFKLVRGLLDPSQLKTLSSPDSLREFVQVASHHRTVYLDNVSHLPDWLSDALCRLCTGDGYSKRELYSDDDDVVYSYRGLGGINGINLVASKSDLLDRGIIWKLAPIPERDRLTEEELWSRFEEVRSSTLEIMFDALAKAMALRPGVKLEKSPRLADFAHWGVAITEALGFKEKDFLEAYGINVQSQNEAALEDSLVAQAILGFLQLGESWTGTPTQLLATLNAKAESLGINVKDKAWPKAPNAMSKRLHEVAPNLRRAGIEVLEKKTGGIRIWSLHRQGREKTAPTDPTNTAESDRLGEKDDPSSTNDSRTSPHNPSGSTLTGTSSKANSDDSVDDVGIFSTLAGSRAGVSSGAADEGEV